MPVSAAYIGATYNQYTKEHFFRFQLEMHKNLTTRRMLRLTIAVHPVYTAIALFPFLKRVVEKPGAGPILV